MHRLRITRPAPAWLLRTVGVLLVLSTISLVWLPAARGQEVAGGPATGSEGAPGDGRIAQGSPTADAVAPATATATPTVGEAAPAAATDTPADVPTPAATATSFATAVATPAATPAITTPATEAVTATAETTATATATVSAAPQRIASPSPAADGPTSTPAPRGTMVQVDGYARVIDGNTLEVRIDGRRTGISVVGIDVPAGNTDCGRDATERLTELVRGGIELEEPDGPAYDERNLRRYIVHTKDDRSVSAELVREGLARTDDANAAVRERDELHAQQVAAEQADAGCVSPSSLKQPGSGGTVEAVAAAAGNELLARVSAAATVAQQWFDGADASANEGASAAESAKALPSTEAAIYSTVPADFAQDVVARGFNRPTNFAFLPDGRILVAEKHGIVRIVVGGTVQATPFLDISSRVNDYWDRGLLGLAVDPNFNQNGYVYVYYIYEHDASQYSGTKTARLSRFTASGSPGNYGNTASVGSEQAILGSVNGPSCNTLPAGADCIPADSYYHMGGGIKFTSQGYLMLTTGDGGSLNGADDNPLRSQNLDSLSGKLVRITTSGAGVSDNPYWNGSASAIRSKVWAYGLRNPFRFDLRPNTDVAYIGDVGSNRWEELNAGIRGANFGWPCYEGREQQPGYAGRSACQNLYGQGASAVTMPLYTYENNPSAGGSSIIGGVFYTATAFPSAYRNAYFFADYSRGTIRTLTLQTGAERIASGPTDFAAQTDFPVAMQQGPDGSLYYLPIYYGEIRRIRYTATSDTDPPSVTAVAPPDRQTGVSVSANVTATFDEPVNPSTLTAATVKLTRQGSSTPVSATFAYDPAARTVTLNPNADLEPNVTYTATVTTGVQDTAGNPLEAARQWTFTTASTANLPPAISITSPTASQRFVVGDTVTFAATASDPEDGTLSGTSVSWRITLWHCPAFGDGCHPHPYQVATGTSGSFVWPSHGDGTYFELEATATDSAGVRTVVVGRADPRTVTLTLDTVPPGLQVSIDGTVTTAPMALVTIPGEQHVITVPSPQGGDPWASWSDGGALSHTVTVSEAGQTVVATFGSRPTPTPTTGLTATPTATSVASGPSSCPVGQYLVEWFPNRTLSGTPAYRECNFRVNRNWGYDSPGHGLDPDSFSVRWTGRFSFDAGSYTFESHTDDGMRVLVDGVSIIDEWRPQSYTEFFADRTLTPGEHEVKVEYFEAGGWATAFLNWHAAAATATPTPAAPTPTSTPTGVPGPTACAGNEFLTEYFANQTLSGQPAFRRCEPLINANWGDGGPGNGLNADGFSVRWTGQFAFAAGNYTFFGNTDDGMRAWIDGVPLFDAWRTQSNAAVQGYQSLSAGQHDVKVEYFEAGGWANAYFAWGPTAAQGPSSCTDGSYLAEYFPNRTLSGTPALRTCEAWVGQSWGYDGPGAGISADNFSVRWSGRFSLAPGTYTFFGSVDDGMRATVDGQPVFDEWRTQSYSEYQRNLTLTGGAHDIVVEYFEDGGWATCYFWWQPAVALSAPGAPQDATTAAARIPGPTQATGRDGSMSAAAIAGPPGRPALLRQGDLDRRTLRFQGAL